MIFNTAKKKFFNNRPATKNSRSTDHASITKAFGNGRSEITPDLTGGRAT